MIEISEPANLPSLVRSLNEIGRDDIDLAGSKSSALGELMSAGFPVPPGYVIETIAYRAFLSQSNLKPRIVELLRDLDVDDVNSLNKVSVHIRSEINRTDIPTDVASAIIDAHADFRSEPMAVRASTTIQNTASASYAGMTEARLNVRGEQDLLLAVKHCWSSLFTPRSIHYLAGHGQSIVGADIAVLVQRQVDAAKSGTLVTVDPVSCMKDRFVIEGTLGLGEATVGGSVLPDRYVIEKSSNVSLEREIHHKEVVVGSEEGRGTLLRRVSAKDQDAPVLDELEVQLLVDFGTRIEALHECPQSLEWAIDRYGVTWILQARPAPCHEDDVAERVTGVLRGTAAMNGLVAGRVRVVDSLSDAADFRNGEILVAHDIAPDWTPLMQRAAAVVTDKGGATSHASTVARELRIPCLVGTIGATSELNNGDLVTVDATNGTVSKF